MTGPTPPRGRRPRPHAQLHLPALSPEQALLLVQVLERAIAALYRAHGEAMVELTAARIDRPVLRTRRYTGTLPDDFPF
jgi:hypothetical protein